MKKPMKNYRIWSYENGVVAMLGITFGLVIFDRLALIFLLPFITPEFNLSNTEIGLLSSILALTWAISGYLLGSLSDKRGNRKGMLVFLVVVFSICSIFSGVATSFASLLIIRAVMGFSEGPVLPIAQAIMAEESSDSRRGFNMGVMQNAAATLLAGIAGPPIMVALATAFGWRAALCIAGFPGLVMALMIWRFLRSSTIAHTSQAKESGHRLGLAGLLAYRNVWLCILIACGQLICLMVLTTFAPLHLVRVRALTPAEMGIVMSMLGLGTFFWSFAIPLLSDRVGRKPVVTFFSFAFVAAPLILAYADVSVPVLATLLFISFVGPGCGPLVLAVIPSETVSSDHLAAALGLVMGVGELVGGVFAPTLTGMMTDAFGLLVPFYVSAGGALFAGISSLFLIETAPARKQLL